MSTNYVVGVRIDGNAASYLRATQQAQQGTRAFVQGVKAEYGRLKSFMLSTQGQIAQLGAGVGMVQIGRNAAVLEKKLIQARLTAGMSHAEQMSAYKEMYSMVRKNGGAIDDTTAGFNNLLQTGLKYKAAIAATEAVSLARAVTGANEQTVSTALTVGAANYGFDLAKAGVAKRMLDQMTVAGRLGSAELENLSSIFPRVASGAQSAGMGFSTTLAFIEGLSQLQQQPEKLATLAESTLRLFSNAQYSKDAERATGVKFFGAGGGRRDALAVLEDMRKAYSRLTTDAQRFQYVSKAFGKTDLDTQRGLTALLSSDSLKNIRNFNREIGAAGGTLERDVGTAMNNAVSQAERLRGVLRQTGEEFARPINDSITGAIKYMLNSKVQGGLELGGGTIMGGAAAGAAGVYAMSRILPGAIGKLVGRGGGLAAGVAEGKALQAATGVAPVYVTNWAEMGGGSSTTLGTAGAAAGGAAAVGMLSKLRNVAGVAALVGNAPLGVLAGSGAAGLGMIASGAGLAGMAGYGLGRGLGIYERGFQDNKGGEGIGELVARFMGMLGSEEAKRAVSINDALKNSKVGGEITIRVAGNPNVAVQAEVKPFTGTRMNALGQTMRGAGE